VVRHLAVGEKNVTASCHRLKSAFSWRDWQKPRHTSVTTAGILAEVRNGILQNTVQAALPAQVRLAERRGGKTSRYGTNDRGLVPGWLRDL